MSSKNNICCYICSKQIDLQHTTSISTQYTTYTVTPMKTYLEQLSEQFPLTASEEELYNIFLCEECLYKINDYDLACLTARNIENDLRDLLKKSKQFSIKPELCIKEENQDYIIKKEIQDNSDNDNDHLFNLDEETSSNSDDSLKNTKRFKRKYKKRKTSKNLKKTLKCKNKSSTSNNGSKITPDVKNCSICGHQTKTVTAMKHHMKTHLNAKQETVFRCEKCRMTYTNKIDLDVHLEKHIKMIPQNPLQCVECEKIFSCRTNLFHHIPLHSGEFKIHVCELCGREFKHRRTFFRHKQSHANIKTKECTVCGRLFSEADHLIRHMRTHTGEKPYQCIVCDRKFANKYNMKSHMKLMHKEHTDNQSESKVHTCIVCNKSFAQALVLKMHLQKSHQMAMDE